MNRHKFNHAASAIVKEELEVTQPHRRTSSFCYSWGTKAQLVCERIYECLVTVNGGGDVHAGRTATAAVWFVEGEDGESAVALDGGGHVGESDCGKV